MRSVSGFAERMIRAAVFLQSKPKQEKVCTAAVLQSPYIVDPETMIIGYNINL